MSDDPRLDELEKASAETNAAWREDPTPEKYRAHLDADIEMCAYRASKRPSSGAGPTVGGGTTIGSPDRGE